MIVVTELSLCIVANPTSEEVPLDGILLLTTHGKEGGVCSAYLTWRWDGREGTSYVCKHLCSKVTYMYLPFCPSYNLSSPPADMICNYFCR